MPVEPDRVRVRLKNGVEATITSLEAERAGLKALKKPALRRDGRPLPLKHRVPLGGNAVAADTPPTEADASESQED